jgi:starch synthase (maltosyl-transferring)
LITPTAKARASAAYFHYSETHDNSRLAEKGRAWSLMRNRLCALTSPSGGFGFTCGVEWLAAEKIRVHGNTGLNWNAAGNIVPELAQLNALISDHPCFFDGAKLTRLSAPDSPIYALLRESAEGKDSVLVLVNTDVEKSHLLALTPADLKFEISNFQFDLLGQPLSQFAREKTEIIFTLAPGACHCLAPTQKPVGLSGENYRHARAQAAFAIQALSKIVPAESVNSLDWRWLAEQVESSPENFLAAASEFAARETKIPFANLLRETAAGKIFPRVVAWTLIDARRVTPVPPGHLLLIEDSAPFRATLEMQNEECRMKNPAVHVQSIAAGNRHIACFAPRDSEAEAELVLERYAENLQKISATIRFLAPEPAIPNSNSQLPALDSIVLLTNGIGGMARLCADLGRVNSKYDCALGANLNPTVPVDRHVFVKRIRVWVNADGFLSPLDFKNLASFDTGSPATWNFVANAGDGRTVEIELRAEMLDGKNTTVFHFSRPTAKRAHGKQLPDDADVRLTVRLDIEDRNFHSETKRNGGADFHFSSNTHTLDNKIGFAFTPVSDRQLRVFASSGEYHPQPEWCENIPHPVEQTRGQTASGDAYSPGWFELPLPKGGNVELVITADRMIPTAIEIKSGRRKVENKISKDVFGEQLESAAQSFVVRRDKGKTVIAGYPWFLDWGRDSLICARGLLAARMVDEVKQLLLTFARFEKDGTLPNTIHGDDVSNRDTCDAPLWFAVACEELAQVKPDFHSTTFDSSKRTVREVLESIATNYARGTPNGIRMDADSALIWSPSHFTWMDTNYPAGTPREGYPVEIQVLWIRLLLQLEKISAAADKKKWRDLADHATASFEKLFWLEECGWFADVLLGGSRVIARDATASDALRSNCLFAVSLGLIAGERAKRCVEAAQKFLVVPGGLRSLAPLPFRRAAGRLWQ